MSDMNNDLVSKIENAVKALEKALDFVQAERRNLMLECREVRQLKEDLDDERRAIFRERKEMATQRTGLASTCTNIESKADEIRTVAGKLMEEPLFLKRFESSVATLQRSITYMRLEISQNPSGKFDKKPSMEKLSNTSCVQKSSSEKKLPRKQKTPAAESELEELISVKNRSDSAKESCATTNKRRRRKRLSEVEKLQASLKTARWSEM